MADSIRAASLPRTRAVTAPSILIKAGPVGGAIVTIGAVKKFGRSITRNNTRRFELDSDVPGLTAELIPNAVTGFTLSISRAMLQRSTMMKAFGFSGIEDLTYQNIPITLEEHRYRYDETDKTEHKQIVEYTGCYFNSNPQEVSIDGDWLLVQDATLDVASCVVHDEK